MQAQQLAGADDGLRNALSQRLGAHAVLHGQHTGFELVTHRPVSALGGIVGCRAGLLGEVEVRVARVIRGVHEHVARKRRGDAELLLRPIDVRQAIARLRPNQSAQPHRRPEHEACVTRLVASGAGTERRK